MRILFYVSLQFCITLGVIAQSNNALQTSFITATAWTVDECYIDSMLYPKAINSVTHFYENGDFTRFERDTLIPGPTWSFVNSNQLTITYSNTQFNELYNIVVLEPNVLILKHQVYDSDKKLRTVEIRYKPYIKN
jgi:hypothetical protein